MDNVNNETKEQQVEKENGESNLSQDSTIKFN